MKDKILLTIPQSDWVKEQFMKQETSKEYFEKRYIGFWPERMETMDPIDQILNYIDMNIVALEDHERDKLRKYLMENFFIQEGIKEE